MKLNFKSKQTLNADPAISSIVLCLFSGFETTLSHVLKITNISSTPIPSSKKGAKSPSCVQGYKSAADKPIVKPKDKPMETKLATETQNLNLKRLVVLRKLLLTDLDLITHFVGTLEFNQNNGIFTIFIF